MSNEHSKQLEKKENSDINGDYVNGDEDMFSNNDDFNDMPIPVFETH